VRGKENTIVSIPPVSLSRSGLFGLIFFYLFPEQGVQLMIDAPYFIHRNDKGDPFSRFLQFHAFLDRLKDLFRFSFSIKVRTISFSGSIKILNNFACSWMPVPLP